MKNKDVKNKKCESCIHENACKMWNIGTIHNANATNCANYESLKESNAYFLGVRSSEDDAYSRGCLAGIELGKNDSLCGISKEDAEGMICTIDTFKKLALNIHGIIGVVDDRNFEKMREILNKVEHNPVQ